MTNLSQHKEKLEELVKLIEREKGAAVVIDPKNEVWRRDLDLQAEKAGDKFTVIAVSFPQQGRAASVHGGEAFGERGCANHIVLCHPPLAAHNPQKSGPYLPAEQDARLRRIVDEYPHVLFLSGHTHLYPEIEPENEGNIPRQRGHF